jgi:hypothetical protein
MQNLPAAVFRIMRSSYSRDPSPTCTGADGVYGFAGEPDGGAGAGGRAGGAVLGGAGADEGAEKVITMTLN